MPRRVCSHPLVAVTLARVRDRRSGHDEFRALSGRIITMLAYEATADLETVRTAVETPLAEAEARMISQQVVAVPVLRAWLGLLGPVMDLLPGISVGYLGLERDEETAVARIYYNKLPRLAGRVPLLLDPMLATGGSATQAVTLIKEAGGSGIRMICVVAAPEGVRALEAEHPDVVVHTAALDERLDERAYIVPGLGDFGDRLFGTV